jgi:type II secretory ATPase GspE/PulE/Tfp pilus assembly ATPase PilB-like protein
MVRLDSELRKAVLAKADLDQLEALLQAKGHATIFTDGRRLVEAGVTTRAELQKACGISADDVRSDEQACRS